MDAKCTADVSIFMLFEATGDSEADCDPIMDGEYVYGIARACVDDHDDDDAQSCSYDRSDNCDAAELINNGYDSCNADDDEHDDEKKEDDEEKADAYGTSYCEDDDEMGEHQKSCVSFDSGKEFVDEREKNRLFWEACLAS